MFAITQIAVNFCFFDLCANILLRDTKLLSDTVQKVCVAYIKENSNVIAALVCKYSWRFQNVAQFNFIYLLQNL